MSANRARLSIWHSYATQYQWCGLGAWDGWAYRGTRGSYRNDILSYLLWDKQRGLEDALLSPQRDVVLSTSKRYIKYCDDSIPLFKTIMTVAWLTIARIWLVIYYPLDQNGNPKLPADAQESKFLGAIKILELSTVLITTPGISKWTWHSKAHVQWHALAIVLAEICLRPSSRECDIAWKYAKTVYNRWNLRADKSKPWRPIKRLMAKAHYIRGMQTRSNERQPHSSRPRWCQSRLMVWRWTTHGTFSMMRVGKMKIMMTTFRSDRPMIVYCSTRTFGVMLSATSNRSIVIIRCVIQLGSVMSWNSLPIRILNGDSPGEFYEGGFLFWVFRTKGQGSPPQTLSWTHNIIPNYLSGHSTSAIKPQNWLQFSSKIIPCRRAMACDMKSELIYKPIPLWGIRSSDTTESQNPHIKIEGWWWGILGFMLM